jgi:hypothetical protein
MYRELVEVVVPIVLSRNKRSQGDGSCSNGIALCSCNILYNVISLLRNMIVEVLDLADPAAVRHLEFWCSSPNNPPKLQRRASPQPE